MSRFKHLDLGQRRRPPGLDLEHEAELGPQILRDEEGFMHRARTAMAEGRFEAALLNYSRALSHNNGRVEAWTGQVQALLRMNEPREARIWVNKALEVCPEAPELLAAKGVVLARLEHYSDALAYSDAALGKKGGGPDVWLARGEVLLGVNLANAAFCFRKATEPNPRDPRVLIEIGRAYLSADRHQEARRYLQQAVEIEGTSPLAWFYLGYAQLESGLGDRAKQSFGEALKLRADFPEAQRALAQASRGAGPLRMLKELLGAAKRERGER